MSIYLYRRPENSSAQDLYEKIGRTLLMGCDFFATTVVTYYNQEIIARRPPEQSLFVKVWNVVKLILAPLGIVGVIFLELSDSYSRLRNSILVRSVLSEDEAIQEISLRLHRTNAIDRKALGDRDIWEYVEEVTKKRLASSGVPRECIIVDRESGEVEIRKRIPPLRISFNRPEKRAPESVEVNKMLVNIFCEQLDLYKSFVRKDPGKGRRGCFKRALLRKPHRFYIFTTNRSHLHKKVKIAYLDSMKQLKVRNHRFTGIENFENDIVKVMNSSYYSLRMFHDYEKLETLQNFQMQLLSSLKHEMHGVEICPVTFRFKTISRIAHDLTIQHHYPIYLNLSELMGRIAAHHRQDQLAFDSRRDPPVFVSRQFLQLKQQTPDMQQRSPTNQLCDAIFAIVRDIPHTDDRAPYYRICADVLCAKIWNADDENWSDFIALFKSGNYTVNRFLKLLERFQGLSTEEILYELRKIRTSELHKDNPSLLNELIVRRNRAAELFADYLAEKYQCSAFSILRHLSHQGLGLTLPEYSRPLSLLPAVMRPDVLLEEFSLWLSPEKLQLHSINLKSFSVDKKIVRAITDPFLQVEPYSSQIEEAKNALKDSSEHIIQGRLYLTNGAKRQPENGVGVHSAAIDLGAELREQLDASKEECNVEEYTREKEQLIYAALTFYDREIEQEYEDSSQGKLGEWFYYPTRLRILENQEFLQHGALTEVAVRAFLEGSEV